MIAIAIFFNVLWRYIADPRRKLMDHQMNERTIRDVNSQYVYGPLLYVAAFLLAFISAGLSFGLCTVLAIFFPLPRSPLAQGD
jgi:hypothetical protein